jgi:hypothetical protein
VSLRIVAAAFHPALAPAKPPETAIQGTHVRFPVRRHRRNVSRRVTSSSRVIIGPEFARTLAEHRLEPDPCDEQP